MATRKNLVATGSSNQAPSPVMLASSRNKTQFTNPTTKLKTQKSTTHKRKEKLKQRNRRLDCGGRKRPNTHNPSSQNQGVH